MFSTPHKLYLVTSNPTQKDSDGFPIPETGGQTENYLCDCFLHDVTTQMNNAFAGKGISVRYYVNLARRNDLKLDQDVVVYERDGSLRGKGTIRRIDSTGGMQFAGYGNYTVIYI